MSQSLIRRDFFKLAALAGVTFAFGKFIKDPEDKEGIIPVSGSPERGTDYFAAVSKGHGSVENIIQTGVSSLEINGQKFRVEIDRDIFAAMILHQASIQKDSVFTDRTRRWLDQNELEIEIYDFPNNPLSYYLAEGYFVAPELHLGRAKIGIAVHQIENLYHRAMRVGQIDPAIIIPHEVNHLLDYIKSPHAYLARMVARVAEVAVAAAMAKIAGDDAKERGVGTGIGILRQGTTFVSMMSAFYLFNIILGIDQHSNVTENEMLTEQVSEDPEFRELAFGVVKFTPEI